SALPARAYHLPGSAVKQDILALVMTPRPKPPTCRSRGFLRLFQDENLQLRMVPFDADRVGEAHGATTDDSNVVIQFDPYSLTHKNCRFPRSGSRARRRRGEPRRPLREVPAAATRRSCRHRPGVAVLDCFHPRANADFHATDPAQRQASSGL